MALKPLQAQQPNGMYDGYDAIISTIKGGEIVTLTNYAYNVGTDVAAVDTYADGYILHGTTRIRPIVTTTIASGTRPYFLADDGIAGYGTLFGSILGGTTGQILSGGVIGPSTATGSGKITIWGQPGLYAVTLDAVDTTALTGLVQGNATLDVGDALYATTLGILTPDSSKAVENTYAAGRFVEFATNGSLVTTPNTLVGNAQASFTQAVLWFNPGE